MKNIITTLVLIALTLASCTNDFQEINTNPNAPIEVQPSLLLRNVIWNYGEQMSYEGFVAGNLLSQHLAMVDFNLFDRHSLTEPQFGGNPWDILYTNLRDNEILLEKAKSEASFSVYKGPALILKAYMTAALTDMYGDVPYSEALQGRAGIITPKYDLQELIYTGEEGILANLDAGIEAIIGNSSVLPLEGDILFNGDLNAWKRFANSLKLKALMRISSRVDVGVELQSLVTDSELIEVNTQNAAFDFSDTEPNAFRMATARTGDFNLYLMSETIEDILKEYNDPRIGTFFREASNGTSGFEGLLNGQDASNLSISVADYSLSGTVFRENTGMMDANFMTAWETNFLLAEAASEGLIMADAKALYELAVAQAFEYWNTELPANYFDNSATNYDDASNKLEPIITQKWLASICNGYEGWIEYRRTGFPALRDLAASLNDDLIPVRLPYPTDEDALNTENFGTAAAATDNNSVNSPVWWDK